MVSERRVDMDRLQELVRLYRMGTSSMQICKLLRMSPNTERPYREAVARAGLLEGPVEQLPELEALKAAVARELPGKARVVQASSIEEWREEITALARKGLQARAIYDRLVLNEEGRARKYEGTLSAIKRLYRRIVREQGVRAEDVAIPVESGPGEIAQVDFGYVGKLYDPAQRVLRRAWVFVLVLAFSRHMFARIVFDQKVETWLQLHIEAMHQLGGVVETFVPDNLKAAVVRAAFGIDSPCALNRSYRELARHYKFKIDPTPPRSPKKKGKAESGVKYVKRNGLKGREGQDAVATELALQKWLVEIAGMREHGSTGRRPLEVFEQEERPALRLLPTAPFELVEWKEAKVHTDSHVEFDRRLYSVPWRLLGKQVWIKATKTSVVIYCDDARVATHDRTGPRRSTQDEHLPEDRAPLRHRGRRYWEERAQRIGPHTLAHVRAVFDSDEVLSMLRPVQAIVTHLEPFPRERAEAACQRASHYGNFTFQGVRDILRKGLDWQPLAPAEAVAPPLLRPRFDRGMGALFHHLHEEEANGCDGRSGTPAEEAAPVRSAPDVRASV